MYSLNLVSDIELFYSLYLVASSWNWGVPVEFWNLWNINFISANIGRYCCESHSLESHSLSFFFFHDFLLSLRPFWNQMSLFWGWIIWTCSLFSIEILLVLGRYKFVIASMIVILITLILTSLVVVIAITVRVVLIAYLLHKLITSLLNLFIIGRWVLLRLILLVSLAHIIVTNIIFSLILIVAIICWTCDISLIISSLLLLLLTSLSIICSWLLILSMLRKFW